MSILFRKHHRFGEAWDQAALGEGPGSRVITSLTRGSSLTRTLERGAASVRPESLRGVLPVSANSRDSPRLTQAENKLTGKDFGWFTGWTRSLANQVQEM